MPSRAFHRYLLLVVAAGCSSSSSGGGQDAGLIAGPGEDAVLPGTLERDGPISGNLPGPDAGAGTSVVGLWQGAYKVNGDQSNTPVPLDVVIDQSSTVYLGFDHLAGMGLGTISATGDMLVTVTGTAGSTITYTGHFEGDSGSGSWTDLAGDYAGTWALTRRQGATVAPGLRAICDEIAPCTTGPTQPYSPSAVVGCVFAFVDPSPSTKILVDRLASCRPAASCDALFACYSAGSLADVYVSQSGSDANSGATPGQAKRTLNAAITATSANGTVHIATGTYQENVLISRPLTLQGGYDAAFSRIDPVASPVTIDGRGLAVAVAAMLATTPARLALKNLRVINGLADGLMAGSGGGLSVGWAPTEVNLENCTFSGNRAAHGGGAIKVNNGGGLTLTGCTFQDNTAGGNGGAVQVNDSTLVVTGCTLEGNTANDNAGGAIDGNRSTVTVSATTIRNNRGPRYGGGINLWESKATIDGCTITGNQAISNGGGVAVGGAGGAESYSLKNSTVTGNSPDQVSGPYTDLGGNTLK
jgi:predicted outer membrane repeat protein